MRKGRTAVLLDSCFIGQRVSIDSMIHSPYNYFVTLGVLRELEVWKEYYENRISKIGRKDNGWVRRCERAIPVMEYFYRNPTRVITYTTEQDVRELGYLTPKSVVREVFLSRSEEPIRSENKDSVLKEASSKLITHFLRRGMANGLTKRRVELLNRSLIKLKSYLEKIIKEDGGIPSGSREVDANMVSVARNFGTIRPRYRTTCIWTHDWDVQLMVALCNQV
jgi:hypothetical protein